MKSEGRQVDFVDQQRLCQAYRIAADYAMHSPFHSQQEREERRDWYNSEADRLEGKG